MSERYNVVLEGKVRPEADRDAVISDLAALVGRDDAFARELLSGRPVTLKSNVGEEEGDEAVAALRRIGVLASLQRAPDLQVDAEVDARLHQRPRPALWNPNAAACWSVLFTPVFGAWLHLKNWRALDRTDRVGIARTWLLASVVVFLVTLCVSLAVPASGNALRVLNFVYLMLWYFAAARPQAKVVGTEFGQDYIRRPWWRPLLIAVVAVIGTMIVAGLFESWFGYEAGDQSKATRL